jgi:hypothetical protein
MKKFILLLTLFPVLLLNAQLSEQFPMVPGVPVVHSPKSTGVFRGTPSIAMIPNGNIVVSNDIFGTGADGKSLPNRTDIFISRDKGLTWTFKTSINGAVWSGLFFHNNKLYLMGADTSSGANFVIRSSSDQGSTWSAPTVLIPGGCHGSSTPVLIANNRIYKAYEHHFEDTNGKWMSGNRSFIISAPVNADLMNAANWTVSNEIQKPTWVDGTGWLESNAVIGRDGKIKGISRLASMEGIYAGYYSLLNDNQIEEGSARKIQFWGGASKFNIRYDAVTDKYWSLANYAPSQLKEGNRSAGGVRSVLALTSSSDLEEWTVNAIVLAHPDPVNVGFQYVDWIFDGNDILFTSRTAYDDGMGGADNYHNANFMTFHRITNYASATTPAEWEYLMPNDGWSGVVKSFDASNGKGLSKDNPIIIDHPGQLVYLSEQVYQGNSYAGKYFLMNNDLDLNEFNYLPIGWYVLTTNNKPFSGHFDGGGHNILNLKINRNDDVYTSNAIFGYTLGGSISNLGVAGNSNIYVGGMSAGIVAIANGTVISNCFSTVNVQASSQAAGILAYGVNSPVITNCYNRGSIHLATTSTTNKYAGGIIGFFNTGSVSNCYNTGSVTTLFTETANRGGIAGTGTSNPVNCYYKSGSVSSGNNVGTSVSDAEMKIANMVSLLNNTQVPQPWIADYNPNINDGYPVLSWQDANTSGIDDIYVTSFIELKQNTPNPANSSTAFSFDMMENGHVALSVYNMMGEMVNTVFDGYLQSGSYSIPYSIDHLAQGIYFYKIVFNHKYTQTKKMIVSK